VQIRGGRGFETAASLKARGEEGIALERMLRDCRINTIFEGSSEIMRLFIAREALDTHLKTGAAVMNTRLVWPERIKAALRAGWFYVRWYPWQYVPREWFTVRSFGLVVLRKHLRYAARSSRRLARAIFHAMLRYGPKLEREQMLLGRFVDIGTEVFAMTATCLRTELLLKDSALENREGLCRLADYFCRTSRQKIELAFRGIHRNTDHPGYKVSGDVMTDKHLGLEQGIVGR
jgi:hypothetical protein